MTYCVVIIPAGIGYVSIHRYSILELKIRFLGKLKQRGKFSSSSFNTFIYTWMLKHIPVALQGWWAVQVPKGIVHIYPMLLCLPQTCKLTESWLNIECWTFPKCSFKTFSSVIQSTIPSICYFLICIYSSINNNWDRWLKCIFYLSVSF